MKENTVNDMSYLAMIELRNRTRAMSDEEKEFCLHFYSTQMLRKELERRADLALSMLEVLNDILGNCREDMTLEEIQATLKACKTTLKMG